MRLKKFNERYDLLTDEYDCMTELQKINVEIDNKQIEKEDVDWVDILSCKVYWKHELDENKYGIDGIDAFIVKVQITLDVFTYNEEKDMDDNEEIDFEFDFQNADFDVETRNYDNEQKLPFYPRSLEVVKLNGTKEDKAKIKINFYE
jgi:hypothetical protein